MVHILLELITEYRCSINMTYETVDNIIFTDSEQWTLKTEENKLNELLMVYKQQQKITQIKPLHDQPVKYKYR